MDSSVESCFHNWIAQQRTDLKELIEALISTPHDETNLHLLIQKTINHVEDYHNTRSRLAQQNAPSLFSSPWSTPFENSFLWIGGLRASVFIRFLINSQSAGPNIDQLQPPRAAQLSSRLNLHGHEEKLGEFSTLQLSLIDSLHRITVVEEDKLSTRMARLQACLPHFKNCFTNSTWGLHQESIADEPLLIMICNNNSNEVGDQSSAIVDQAMVAHDLALAQILKDADNLRLTTLKEFMAILTPLQAVDLLVASNRLQLNVHEWGTRKDQHT